MSFIRISKGILRKILKQTNTYETYRKARVKCELFRYSVSWKYQYYLRKNKYAPLLRKKLKPPVRLSKSLNVIILTVDCLRADHLDVYGYFRQTAPFLRSILHKCATFTNAISAASWTLPSQTSILTGLYSSSHGAGFSGPLRHWTPINTPNMSRADVFSISEILDLFGYKTMIASAISLVRLSVKGRFGQLLHVDDRPAGDIINVICNCIRKKKRGTPFFSYIHLSDLHEPICLSERNRNAFGRIPDLENLERWNHRYCTADGINGPEFELYKNSKIKLYDAAIKIVDEQISCLFSFLENEGLLDSTLIFITADHGEEFWEHFEIERDLFYDPRGMYGVGHGHNIFQEVIHIPLIIYGPEIKKGLYDHYVSNVDMVPTILDILGIKHTLTFDGRNLFTSDRGRSVISGSVHSGYKKKAIINNGFKLIQSPGDNVELFFNLSQDPLEKNDLKTHNEIRTKLKNEIAPFWKQKKCRKEKRILMDEELKQRLKSLGYM